MIVFGLIVFVLALAAIAFIAWPIAAGSAESAKPVVSDDQEAVLAATLSAIERDRNYGLIDDQSAEEARREAQSEFKVDDNAGRSVEAAVSRRARFAAFIALGATPFAAIILYLYLGAPEALGVAPHAAGVTAQQQQQPAALAEASQQRIQMLEMQVATEPSDFEAWMQLGVEYISTGQSAQAARAFGRAVELDGMNAGALGAYGEALVQQAQGAVTGEARALFEKASAISPDDPRAQYYLAEARYQVGAVEEAARGWAKLLNSAPSDAPWFAAVAARMSDAAAEAGLDQADLGLEERVSTRVAAASQAMPGAAGAAGGGSDDFNAVIGRIHDGSASYEDWINAAATYAERGEADRAREMLESAAERYQNAPFVLAQIEKAKAQLEAGQPIGAGAAPTAGGVRNPTAEQVAEISQMSDDDQRQMIAGMVANLAERLKTEPDNLEGWRMLARSYRVLGEPDNSAEAWRELLSRTQGGSEDWRGLAFALLEQRPEGDNSISDELEKALENIRKASPNDPLALYNLGYAAYNRGDKKRALKMWTQLRDSLPAEAPIGPTLERLIADAQAS